MKLCYFNDFTLGVVKGDAVVDVSAVVRDIPHTGPHNLINGLIERFSQYRGKLEKAAAEGKAVPLSQVRIRPPLPKPHNIDCMAVNYMEDGTRTEPAPINAFHKSPSGVIGDGDTMVLPDVPATIFEGEAEMALVIGKRATNVPAAKAMEYIFGYVNFIDGSARGLPPSGNTFFQMKSRDTFREVDCGTPSISTRIAFSARAGWCAATASSTARCSGRELRGPSLRVVEISKLVRSSAASALLICTIMRLREARSRPWWKRRSWVT